MSKKSESTGTVYTLIILIAVLVIIIIAVTIIILLNKNVSTSETLAEIRSNSLGITDESKTESWDTEMVSILTDTSTGVTMYVPIPSGYVASNVTGESTVADGLVIYEGQKK